MDEKKDNAVMDAVHELEEICCGSDTKDKSRLLTRFQAMQDGFHYTVICDNGSNSWRIYDNEKNTAAVFSFGSSVAYLINLLDSMNSEAEFYSLINKDNISNDELGEITELYEKNKKDIEYLKSFIMQRENYNLQDCFSVWDNYRDFFSHNHEWHLVKITRINNSSLFNYSLKLLSDYAHKHIQQDKTLWDIGGRIIPADTYNMNDLSYLFEFDLYKVLVDGSCGVFHVCQHCGKAYFDNDNKTKYCSDCRKNQKQILAENRKSNKSRYLHKRIQDKLKQQKKDTIDFSAESNYYWAVCRGKKPKTKKLESYQNITSEEKYIEWLENTLDTLKAQK